MESHWREASPRSTWSMLGRRWPCLGPVSKAEPWAPPQTNRISLTGRPGSVPRGSFREGLAGGRPSKDPLRPVACQPHSVPLDPRDSLKAAWHSPASQKMMLKPRGVGGFSEAAGSRAGGGGGGWGGKLRAVQPPSYPHLSSPHRGASAAMSSDAKPAGVVGSARHGRTPTRNLHRRPSSRLTRFLVRDQIDSPGPPSAPNLPRKESTQVLVTGLPCSSSRMLSGLMSL